MKIKSLVCIVLASLACTQVMALEIKNGHLVSHKEWATGKAIGRYLSSHKSMDVPKNQLNPTTGIVEFVRTDSSMQTTTGVANKLLTVHGGSSAYAHNDSNTTYNYSYTYSTCAETDLKTRVEECIFYEDTVQLEPGGIFYDSHSPELQVTYNTPGTYDTGAEVYILNIDTGSINNTSASRGTITVS